MSYLRLTTVRDLDGEPIATVNAQFVTSTHLPPTWLIVATADDQDMDAPDALKKAFLPSDMIEPIADALVLLAPHTYAPQAG